MEVHVPACHTLYNSVVYFLSFMSFSVFLVCLCRSAGANFGGEVLEAVAARSEPADGEHLAAGVTWCSCLQSHR